MTELQTPDAYLPLPLPAVDVLQMHFVKNQGSLAKKTRPCPGFISSSTTAHSR